jgi:Tfp pilus assembly protein PilZ
MRLLTLAFVSPDEFLSHYRDQENTGAVFYRSRTELELLESVLMEISFPGLPNRALLRGKVGKITPGHGAWIRIRSADDSTREFLLQIARGEVEVTPTVTNRQFDRFPAELPVDCRIPRNGAEAERLVSRTVDLGAGGAFIRSLSPPPVGTPITLSIGPTQDASFASINLEGRVAWIRSGPDKGFGVRFDYNSKLDGRMLRATLRKASETGRVAFARN